MSNARRLGLVVPALVAIAPVGAVSAAVIPTSFGVGADAEVRDHQPLTNFGASTELASRIVDNFPFGHASDGTDRFSAMYMKFDLTGSTLPAGEQAQVRMTYRNTNLTANRLADTSPRETTRRSAPGWRSTGWTVTTPATTGPRARSPTTPPPAWR